MPFRNFGKYKNRVFVETGTYLGDGVQAALDAGFEEVHSLEVSEELWEHSKLRFGKTARVHLHNLDSSHLGEVIDKINEPITFWLDGHYSGYGTGYGEFTYPVLLELQHIYKHPIHTHTIIIDDLRLVETEWNLKMKDILYWIYKINPDYKLIYEDGYVPHDVLVARVE